MHKVCLSYGVSAASMRLAKYLLNTKADMSLFNSTNVFPQSHSWIKCEKMFHICSATQKSLHMEVTIHFHLRLCESCLTVWFGIVH